MYRFRYLATLMLIALGGVPASEAAAPCEENFSRSELWLFSFNHFHCTSRGWSISRRVGESRTDCAALHPSGQLIFVADSGGAEAAMFRDLEHDKWIATADQFADVRILVDRTSIFEDQTQVQVSANPPLRYGFQLPLPREKTEVLRRGNALNFTVAKVAGGTTASATWDIDLGGSQVAIDAARKCASWIQGLPAEVSPDVMRLVRTHPFFANAPSVAAKSYEQSSVDASGGDSVTTIDTTTKIRPLHYGLFVEEKVEQEIMMQSGRAYPGTRRWQSLYSANGFIELSSRISYTAAGSQSSLGEQVSELIKIDDMVGQIFPLRIGNRFSLRALYRETYRGEVDERTSIRSCEVSRKIDARELHSSLSGDGYVTDCSFSTSYKNMDEASRGRANLVFVDMLGLWLLSSTSFSDHKSMSFLKSFTLAGN